MTISAKRKAKAQQPITCPKCDSPSIIPAKKGFGLGKAVVGFALIGPFGGLAGGLGANKIKLHCLSCGHTFKNR